MSLSLANTGIVSSIYSWAPASRQSFLKTSLEYSEGSLAYTAVQFPIFVTLTPGDPNCTPAHFFTLLISRDFPSLSPGA